MTQFEQLQQALEEKGELMVKSDTGEKFELHKHNVRFDEKSKMIEIDSGDKTFWLVPEKISYMWIHKEARE